jgi:predicted HTH domain antitoxin
MQTTTVDIPAEIVSLLQESHLGSRPPGDQVKAALAIHLFLEGLVSIGKAAELAGEPRVDFEWLLSQMGLPVVVYDVADYEQDLQAITQVERRPAS